MDNKEELKQSLEKWLKVSKCQSIAQLMEAAKIEMDHWKPETKYHHEKAKRLGIYMCLDEVDWLKLAKIDALETCDGHFKAVLRTLQLMICLRYIGKDANIIRANRWYNHNFHKQTKFEKYLRSAQKAKNRVICICIHPEKPDAYAAIETIVIKTARNVLTCKKNLNLSVGYVSSALEVGSFNDRQQTHFQRSIPEFEENL